jgi:uncharacterized protein YceH (UPF0502 family)
LVEKAKTTPDIYPLTLNALRAGCNQKNNRDPVMQLDEDEIEQSLARLRSIGAAEEVQGSGRVSRFRHKLYDWLGVDKVELAVMAELLLRGAQTEGELRGRAARMEPIADVNALKPILASLTQKKLISVSSEGRGHVVMHTLLPPDEAEKERARAHGVSRAAADQPRSTASHTVSGHGTSDFQSALAQVQSDLDELRQAYDELAQRCERNEQEIARLKESLGV